MTSTEIVVPQDAAEWLRDNGWRSVSPPGRPASLWQRDRTEVLLPQEPAASDFSRRFNELLVELARAESKSVDEIRTEIATVGSDICEWRADHNSLIDGSIPLLDGERLVTSARVAFVASAAAAIHRRGYFGHSIPHRARDHAKLVRMGQTKVGSYVIPIISQLPREEELADEGLFSFASLEANRVSRSDESLVTREPYSRQVMWTFAHAAATVQRLALAESAPRTSDIVESVGEGVSYELCSALSSALKAEAIGSIDLNFAWSRRLPIRRGSVDSVSFPKEASAVLDQMTETLRGSSVVAMQTVVGEMYSMRRGRDEDVVVVRAALGGDTRQIRLRLPSQYRHEATLAYDQERLVYVTGKLSRHSGRSWEFEDIADFGAARELPIDEWGRALNEADTE